MRKLAVIASLPLLVAAVRLLPLNRLPPMCVFHNVTGYPCPTCGMTRAAVAVTHLDLARAIAFHPLAVVFAAAAFLLWTAAVYQALSQRETRLLRWARMRQVKLVLSAFGLLFVYGVFRISAIAWLHSR